MRWRYRLIDPVRHTDSEIRSICKEKIESLEHWLRRLIDDLLSPTYGEYFEYTDTTGNRLIKKSLSEQVENRRLREPARYPRKIDAVLLEDAVDIVCKPELFNLHFRAPLMDAFPDGRDEARTFLSRILLPRNHLAHANAISVRQAEQIVCYSNGIIESIKNYYRAHGMRQQYDVPLILKLVDSFGNVFTRSQFGGAADGGIAMHFTSRPEMFLRPGDCLLLEIEVDPAFDHDCYGIDWRYAHSTSQSQLDGKRISIPITNKQVCEQFDVTCRVTSKREWHRLNMGADDYMWLAFKVLPPLE